MLNANYKPKDVSQMLGLQLVIGIPMAVVAVGLGGSHFSRNSQEFSPMSGGEVFVDLVVIPLIAAIIPLLILIAIKRNKSHVRWATYYAGPCFVGSVISAVLIGPLRVVVPLIWFGLMAVVSFRALNNAESHVT